MNPSGGAPKADDQPFPVLLQDGEERFRIQEFDILIQQGDFGSRRIIPGVYRRLCIRPVPGGIDHEIISDYPS